MIEGIMKILVSSDMSKIGIRYSKLNMAVENGFKRGMPDVEITAIPTKDQSITWNASKIIEETIGGKWVETPIFDSFWNGKTGRYIISEINGQPTAVIDSEQVIGLQLNKHKSSEEQYHTTSYGLGEMILDAVTSGTQNIVISIGQSGALDGGLGALQALGAVMRDEKGNKIAIDDNPLINVVDIDLTRVQQIFKNVNLSVVVDTDSLIRYGGIYSSDDMILDQVASDLSIKLNNLSIKMKQKYDLDLPKPTRKNMTSTIYNSLILVGIKNVQPIYEWFYKIIDLPKLMKESDMFLFVGDQFDYQLAQNEILNTVCDQAHVSEVTTWGLFNEIKMDRDDFQPLDTILSIQNGITTRNQLYQEDLIIQKLVSVTYQLGRSLKYLQK